MTSYYNQNFFEYINTGATQSAEQIIPKILDQINISSILDVGCGQGAWLSVWHKLGVSKIMGIDGDYVDHDHLLIPQSQFQAIDLSQPFQLKDQRFDLVQCLEVAEHLPETRAAQFVHDLVKHSQIILFSAAAKGQGGKNHVNEQNYDYWRQHFAEHDYVAIDYLREHIIHNSKIDPWYRYNLFLFVSKEIFNDLPTSLKMARVPDNELLRDVSPMYYQLRKYCIRCLPVPIMTSLARLKEKITSHK